MKVLSIGLDRKIFEEKSEARERMREYAKLVEELHIVIFSKKSGFTNERDGNLFLYPTNSKSFLTLLFDAYKIGERILRGRKNLIITTQDAFETGIVGFLLKKKFNLPLQIQFHTDFFSEYFQRESILNKLRFLLARIFLRYADSIRVVNERLKSYIEKYFPKKQIGKISVLPIYVDLEKIKNAPVNIDLHKKYPQFATIILMASRLSKEKNIELAIKIMPEVIKKYPDTCLLIVGEGNERKKLERLITRLHLNKNVIIEGWQNDIYSYYKSADVFLLTSNYEGYARSLFESFAGGCYIITTDVGACRELRRIYENVAIVPVNNAKILKDVLILYIEKIKRGDVKDLRQNNIPSAFSKGKYLNEYKRLWEETLVRGKQIRQNSELSTI